MNDDKILVSIQCLVYNHEPYLRQCLDGFVMQKTNFRFEAIVHDDVSTDGSAAIIREYAEKYPDIIKPIYETENQYSKRDGSLRRIMNAACKGKYIALCEGDDYWIDPLKLQKQVDFLECNPDYSMTCGRTILYSESKGKNIGENRCRHKTTTLRPKDIILKGGEYISTASILYRKNILEIYPTYCTNCYVGDYPLQIFCAMQGKVYYFDTKMCAYRTQNPNSWCGKMFNGKFTPQSEMKRKTLLNMLYNFSVHYQEYRSIFLSRLFFSLNINIPINKKDRKEYERFYKDYIKIFSLPWRLDFKIRKILPFPILRFYRKITNILLFHKYI